jgi:hypothetical protein
MRIATTGKEASATAGRRETGAILLMAVLLMLLLAMLGFAALDTVRADQQVAGFQNRRDLALYAAEAGLAKAFETLTTTNTPTVPVTSLGDSAVFPYGQPAFRPDPSVTDPIDEMGTGAFPGTSINIGPGATPTYLLQYWRIRVQGEATGGSVARVEAVAGALAAN